MEKTLKLRSEVSNISFAENLVDEISDMYSLNSEIYGNILISVVEAVNNAILHGNSLDSKKFVLIKYHLGKSFVQFNIRDEGAGFDYSHVPDPTAPENIEKPHGRGIFLMSNLADEVNFFNNGAEVELKFNI